MHTEPRPSSVIAAVGLDARPVAGDGVAHAVDDLEGGGGLVVVLVVAVRQRRR